MRAGIISLILFVSFAAVSQELPPIQNFSPSDYHAESQNWSITQAGNKIIYVGNSRGLLRYNGASWRQYTLPNESMVRSVYSVGNRVYAGGFMEFGYWAPDTLGTLSYTSLSHNIRDELLPNEEFWNILRLGQYMIFHSLERLYTYNLDDQNLNWVETESSLPKVFLIGQTVYFQKPGEGIFKLENGRAVLVYGFEPFRSDEVVNIFEQNGEILVLTRQSGFFEIRGQEIRPWATQTNAVLSGVSVYSAIALNEGGYALGTISDGLILLNGKGEIDSRIDRSRGLRNNTVLSLFEGQEGTLWLGLDNGISFINLNSPFRVYQDYGGLTGSVYATVIYDGMLYLGTNQGLYFRDPNSEKDFEMVPGTDGQVWSLDIIDNTLFCGHHAGTFVVEGNMARKIVNTPGTWKISPVPGMPELLLQGNYNGLSVLEYLQGNWRLRNRIGNFDHSSRSFELFGNDIFVNHEYKGLFKVKVNADFTEALEVEMDTAFRGANSGLALYRDDLYFAFREGIFKFDRSEEQFKKDSILTAVIKDNGYVSGRMIPDLKGSNLWIFTERNMTYITAGNLDTRPVVRAVPLTQGERMGITGYESAYGPEGSSTYFFGSDNGYITLNIDQVPENSFDVRIGEVMVSDITSGGLHYNFVDAGGEGEFRNAENNLVLNYYTPEFKAMFKPRFQYRLTGIYDDWSEWSETTSATFSNLPHGTYLFEVRGMIGKDLSRNTASYAFTIARPWYLSGLAILGYVLLAFFGALGIHKAYTRYYKGQQQAIVARNEREMALAREKTEKEIIKLKNKQLKEKFRNKNNELAASTLSIIRKNELLSEVKRQLLSQENEKGNGNAVKQLVQIIDKSLNQTDDWEMFIKAFNQTDRKFMKKLKELHPNLSPNDIKLCAYLRLNLSSKEIAPLLNISPRSVEIKRYRLRKKMHLEHDANLTDYILTF